MKACLYPNCGKDSYSRGLCVRHYHSARSLVRANRTTWEQLEKNGKSLPRQTQWERRKTTITSWFLT